MKKVLVVDDNVDFKKLLILFLEKKGFLVDGADDGKTGYDMCFKKTYDLVIMDIVLPEKDGLHVIFELKKEIPNLKIIAISGACSKGFSQILDMAKKYGAEDVLCKPFEFEELMKSINKLNI